MCYPTIVVSIVNLIISIVIFCSAWNNERKLDDHSEVENWMVMVLNLIFCVFNIRLLNAIWTEKMHRLKHCLEIFIVLFILNIIPLTYRIDEYNIQQYYFKNHEYSKFIFPNNNRNLIYSYIFIRNSSKIFFVIIVFEIYLVFMHYNSKLKCLQQNVSSEAPSWWNPSAPIEQYRMSSSQPHNNTQQSEQFNTQTPVQCAFQPDGQNVSHQLNQNATQQSIQHIMPQPEQYYTQQPITSVYNPPRVVQIPQQPLQSVAIKPEQNLNLQYVQPITHTLNPPPYSSTKDM